MRRAKIQTEDGTILRAYVHSPGPGSHPGIVMCPGFGGVKPHIDQYAALFAEAGFAVLNFDNRGWGTSEGEPRQELNVFKQITDLRDAITFAESQPEFDAEQGFGVWGSSFSGGLAIVTAANDPRVRCVVAQIPNVSGHRNAVKLFSAEQLHEIRRRAAIDRLARLAGEPPMMVPMFSDDPDELCAFPGPVPEEYREAIESGIWINETTIRSLENFIEFEPAGWLPYVTPKPLLMIIAEHDVCTFTKVQREVYETAPEPKKLLTYDGGHFDAYTTFFEQTGPPARDWFVEHLGVSPNWQALGAPTVGMLSTYRATTAQRGGEPMPLWNVYCTEGTYSNEDKRAFAEAITDIYASEAGGLPEMAMPRFYVVVVFHDVPKDSLFIGGVPRNDFVRFSIDHIAYAMPIEFRELLLKFINKTIHPYVRDRGLDWEIHIDDTPRDQWTIQGMRPPDSGSDEEKRWIRDNKPSKPTPSAASTN